ncbi:GntR family transcriptional regulator [Salinibacterium sp. SWN248]|uniref:GntR family transcriptional regulator n=1 Tax=Salinibacterium sp. SWN248 TaxID=2792056 RepID=UPI0018CFCD18|nr:GntR family transcriptional regulator [Salinibacterium sp. SWN248]MBH0024386.1 GntR family transcriptional regulator [Salinibacterium sp. SWN248]
MTTDSLFTSNSSPSIERRGLRDHVYDRVLDVLLGPGVEPGSRLSIDTIARDLGVSPTPVREALVQLERTGLVTRVANKGYTVAEPLAADQLEALFDARLVLESGSAAIAARNPEKLLPVLEKALTQHLKLTAAVHEASLVGEIPLELLRDYFAADWNFHHLIFEHTHNPFLIDMSEAISTRVHRMRQTVATGVSDAEEATAEHRAILDAFPHGPEAVEAAMRSHILKVRDRARDDSVR